MALVDFAPAARPVGVSASLARAFQAVAAAYSAWRTERNRRLTLQSLLEMPAYRLDDLGISVHDVVQAMQSPAPVDCNRK
jgi:uncharacterized protein YjiS (DUF1127 family)